MSAGGDTVRWRGGSGKVVKAGKHGVVIDKGIREQTRNVLERIKLVLETAATSLSQAL